MLPIVLQANAELRCQQMGINPTCIGFQVSGKHPPITLFAGRWLKIHATFKPME